MPLLDMGSQAQPDVLRASAWDSGAGAAVATDCWEIGAGGVAKCRAKRPRGARASNCGRVGARASVALEVVTASKRSKQPRASGPRAANALKVE